MRQTKNVLVAFLGTALLLLGLAACTPSEAPAPADPEPADAADASPPADATDTATSDYRELVAKATAIFQETYPDDSPVLYTALAMPASGVATTASELTNWEFTALLTVGDGSKISQVTYADGAFGSPEIIGTSWFGVEFVALPQGTLTVDEGIKVLNDNGYTQGFSNVSFGTPVVPDAQPMFWFCVEPQIQGVSASTGEFFADLFPCSDGARGSVQE